MPPLAQIQTGQVDLLAMILQSRSLNARLTKNQMDEYIDKVKALPLDKQQEIYRILIEEKEKFSEIGERAKQAVEEYNKNLEAKKREIIKTFYAQAEQEEQNTTDNDISSLLHQLDE